MKSYNSWPPSLCQSGALSQSSKEIPSNVFAPPGTCPEIPHGATNFSAGSYTRLRDFRECEIAVSLNKEGGNITLLKNVLLQIEV